MFGWNCWKVRVANRRLTAENRGLTVMLRAIIERLTIIDMQLEERSRKLRPAILDTILFILSAFPDRGSRRAFRLHFVFNSAGFSSTGENMQQSLSLGLSIKVNMTPVDADQNASNAVLSNQQYSALDTNIFTVADDPDVPGGAIITSVAVGSSTLTGTTTATEKDGTTVEQIQGVATIIVTPPVAPPPPPVPPAASVVFVFGEPFTAAK